MDDSILVAVRLRPLITREIEKNEQKLWQVKNSSYIHRTDQNGSPHKAFRFDRVFDTDATTLKIYKDVCLPIVKSAMQGFNGTIFAYGQTSSGKTYTMMGEYDKKIPFFEKYKGVTHYCIEDIFSNIQEMPDREFLLRVSYLEIYNEKVYDLLSSKNDDLRLLTDSYGNIKVSGLEERIVQTAEQILELMVIGQNKRHTGETQMNRVSSRSHSIFRMIIESRLKDQDVVYVSQLNLVDLAGSEDVKKSLNEKSRQEGVSINLSLSTLCQVISQLSERDFQFINYRNSKLTRLLQNSLGGNARTVIICAVTPTSMKETLSTLEFAQRAKKIQNKPMKNEIATDQALLKQYANKIKKLSEELLASKEKGKELEEKTKQNENLKRQIEALKANFVSQIAISRSSRRETIAGTRDARRFQQFEKISYQRPISSQLHLSTLEESDEDDDTSSFSTNRIFQTRDSLKPRLSSKSISDAETQTELSIENEACSIGTETVVSDSSYKVTLLQKELKELEEFHSHEIQSKKAWNDELRAQLTELKHENSTLKERLDSELSNLRALEEKNIELESFNLDLQTKLIELETSSVEAATELELKHRKELSEIKDQLKETENNELNNLKTFEEKNIELEKCIIDLRQKIIQLETSRSTHVDELVAKPEAEIKHELIECEEKNGVEECNQDFQQKVAQLETSHNIHINELGSKYEKELEEVKKELAEAKSNKLSNLSFWENKISELQDCIRDLKQKILELEDSHRTEINDLKEKAETAHSELNSKLLLIKELEAKHENELHEVKLHSVDEHLQETRKEIYKELETNNRNLKQTVLDLEDQIKAAEIKFEHSQSKINELECDMLKMGERKSQLENKCSEFEQYNSDLKQKITDLEISHVNKIKQLEAKHENELPEVKFQQDHTESYHSDLQHFQETCRELETNNRNLRQTVLDLEDQIKAAKTKFEHSQSKINKLECDVLKMGEIKSQLENKCSEFEQYNSDLKQKMANLEVSHMNKIKDLEHDFEIEKCEWNAKTRALLEDMETKYDQELTDQENKLAEDLQAMFNKRIEIYIKEVDDLEKELKSVKLQNLNLTNIKQEHLKQIKELSDRISAESSDKVREIFLLKKENEKEILALKAERIRIINEYKSKVSKCRDCYMQLEIQAQALKGENERLKSQIGEGAQPKNEEGDKMNNALLEQLVAAESKLGKMTERFKMCKKELDEYRNIAKDADNCKKLKESNKMLHLDLDQKKAKIISLETNNASLIQEINKLRDKAASKDGPCKCKGNSKGSKTEIPASCENTKENSENNNLEEKTDAKLQRIHKPVPCNGDTKKEKDSQDKDKVDLGDLYFIGGGCGTGNAVTSHWLKGKLHKSEKENNTLKKKVNELTSELAKVKKCPPIPNERKPDVEKAPLAVLHEINENSIAQMCTPPQYHGTRPKVLEKQNLKHQKRKSFKPYVHPAKSTDVENLDQESKSRPLKEKSPEYWQKRESSNEVLNVLYGDQPDCNQQ